MLKAKNESALFDSMKLLVNENVCNVIAKIYKFFSRYFFGCDAFVLLKCIKDGIVWCLNNGRGVLERITDLAPSLSPQTSPENIFSPSLTWTFLFSLSVMLPYTTGASDPFQQPSSRSPAHFFFFSIFSIISFFLPFPVSLSSRPHGSSSVISRDEKF